MKVSANYGMQGRAWLFALAAVGSLGVSREAGATNWLQAGFDIDLCYFSDDQPGMYTRLFDGCHPDDSFTSDGIVHNPAECVVRYTSNFPLVENYTASYNVDAQSRVKNGQSEQRVVITASTMRASPDPGCHLKRWASGNL